MIKYKQVSSMPDRNAALDLYQGAQRYFQVIGDDYPSRRSVEADRTALPKDAKASSKHYGLLQEDGQNIGVLDLLVGYPEADTVYIGLLLFPETLQRKGYGKRVVAGLKKHFQAEKMSRLRVATVSANKAALAFWQAQGFQLVGKKNAQITETNVQEVQILDLDL